nr:superinfection immunity protein [Halobacillus massiliensis]
MDIAPYAYKRKVTRPSILSSQFSIPSYLSVKKKKHNRIANLLLGWLIIGWFAALDFPLNNIRRKISCQIFRKTFSPSLKVFLFEPRIKICEDRT